MYKILTATDVICDSTNQANGVISPVLTKKVNKVWSFSFILPPDHPYYDSITEQKTELGVQIDTNDPIFWGTVYATKLDFWGQKTVEVEDMLGYLNYALMSPHRYTSMNVTDILQLAVDVYNAQCTDKTIAMGTVQTTHTAHNIAWSSNYETVLDMLMANVIAKNGGYLRMQYRNGVRYLDYSEDYGSTKQTITIGANLIDFVRESDASGLVSVLIPLGARLPDDEQDVEGVEKRLTIETDLRQTDRIESAGMITAIGRKIKARIWDSVTDPDDLYNIGVAWLADQIADVTITAKAFDLNLSNEEMEEISLYDEVRIISDPHNLDTTFPVMELTLNLSDPASNTLTLGKTEQPSITQTTIESAEKLTYTPTWVDMQVEAATRAAEVLENATNGYIKFVFNDITGVLEQIQVKDLTDPTNKWWRWNVNGLGYTSDGGTTYDVAMTMLGELISNLGMIGGWEISAAGLSKTVADQNDTNKRYRVTINTPDEVTPGTSPVIDFEYTTDGGNTWVQTFYVNGNGSTDALGDSDSDARIRVIKRSDAGTYTRIAPEGIAELKGDYITNYRANGFNIDHRAPGGLVDGSAGVTLTVQGLGWWTMSEVTPGSYTSHTTGRIMKNEWGVGFSQVTKSGNTWNVLSIGNTRICRLRKNTTSAIQYAWGSIYNGTPSQSDASFPKVELPFTFTEEPFVVAQLSPGSGGDGWLTVNTQHSPSTAEDKCKYTPAYDIARGTTGTPNLTINYLVIGEV